MIFFIFRVPKGVSSFLKLVLCSSSDNFGVKAAQIADRKFIRIALIRMNLRSLTVDDFSELSRSKLSEELLLQSASPRTFLWELSARGQ